MLNKAFPEREAATSSRSRSPSPAAPARGPGTPPPPLYRPGCRCQGRSPARGAPGRRLRASSRELTGRGFSGSRGAGRQLGRCSQAREEHLARSLGADRTRPECSETADGGAGSGSALSLADCLGHLRRGRSPGSSYNRVGAGVVSLGKSLSGALGHWDQESKAGLWG